MFYLRQLDKATRSETVYCLGDGYELILRGDGSAEPSAEYQMLYHQFFEGDGRTPDEDDVKNLYGFIEGHDPNHGAICLYEDEVYEIFGESFDGVMVITPSGVYKEKWARI